MIQLLQTLEFPVIGDGTSTIFSYDLTQPPFNSSEFTGSGTQPFILGSPVSVSVVIGSQQVSGLPLTRQSNVQYPIGRVVEWNDPNGVSYIYQCTVSGITGTDTSGFPFTLGQTYQDGGVLWTCLGLNNVVAQYVTPTGNASLADSIITLTFNIPLAAISSVIDTYGNLYIYEAWNIALNLFYNSYA